MKERPILFSGPMVKAILDGTKTQTRRIVKPQPALTQFIDTCHYNDTGWAFWETGEGNDGSSCTCKNLKQPFGNLGDHLWVREKIAVVDRLGFADHKADSVLYAADPSTSQNLWFRPSIHMPRWASRITLEVVTVRVERLQDIGEEDAKAEGVKQEQWSSIPGRASLRTQSAREAFEILWESINGPASWEANPWVWVVTFRRIENREGMTTNDEAAPYGHKEGELTRDRRNLSSQHQ
jgi:hypothetical protein